MKKRILVLCVSMCLICSMALNLFGCTRIRAEDLMEGIEPNEVTGKAVDDVFADAQMALALKLFRESYGASEDKNVLISPLSIQLALAMTANGADGQTRTEMEALLGGGMSMEELNEYLHSYVNGLSTSKSTLKIANSIWLRDEKGRLSVEEDFLQTNADYYGAQVYKAKFNQGTCKDMNRWVSNETDGMIDQILEEIPPEAVMYLINTLAFEAEWQTPYTREEVRNGTFTSIAGEKQTVKMMSAIEGGYFVTEDARGFMKSYKGGYSFVALLPNEELSLEDYVANLDAAELIEALRAGETENQYAFVSMPKFSYESEMLLNDTLKELGMTSAFDGGAADFSKLGHSSEGNLYLGDVHHKTYISVGEQGTRAGAATVVEMVESSGEPMEETLRLDRPFLYMIIDHSTNLPIFIGTLTDVS